jgi:ubiquinone/menaquinone biosynthesis C-methylase UbiE/DNA-binding transcriptional ArsR family regulator
MDWVRTFKALADPTRLRVLAAVAEDELAVGEIQEVVDAAQSAVSRNLAILRDAGFVRDRKQGTNVYFSLRPDMPEAAKQLFDSVARKFGELPGVKEDQRRLSQCRHRRAQKSRDYFEAVAGDWERIRKSYFDDRVTSLALEKLMPSDLILADVGCGTGSLSLELARFAKRVVAIDLSRAMLTRAAHLAKEKKISNVEFRRGDVEKLPIPDNSVDAAFCVMVLHFLENPDRAIQELCRITRPGGSVIVVDLVPHEEEWMKEEMAHRWLGFNRSSIERWFRAARAAQVEFELTGSYAGEKMNRNGKRPVEIFVARASLPGKGIRPAAQR